MTKKQLQPILPNTLFVVGLVLGILASCFSYTILEVGFYLALAILLPLCYVLSLVIGHNDAGWLALIVVFPLASIINGVILGYIS